MFCPVELRCTVPNSRGAGISSDSTGVSYRLTHHQCIHYNGWAASAVLLQLWSSCSSGSGCPGDSCSQASHSVYLCCGQLPSQRSNLMPYAPTSICCSLPRHFHLRLPLPPLVNPNKPHAPFPFAHYHPLFMLYPERTPHANNT